MQKYLTLVFAALFCGSLFAQHEPIQPFEELGIKVKVLTLSNGKYQESFPNDTTFRFGSVMFNRVTGEVVTVIENDTLYGEYNLKAEVVSRWLSPDPLAHEYTNLSPYVFVANNPIIYVDPDGREIWIGFQVTKDDGTTEAQKVQYKEGKLYGADGKEYTGGNEYATKVMNDLNQLSKDDDVLKERIGTLETSKNIHTVEMTKNPEDGNANVPLSQKDDEAGVSTGSKTTYNPDKDTNVRGDKRAPRAGLAHEMLGHGYDSDQGKADYSKTDNGIRMYEVNAVNVENRARAAAGDEKKTTYGGKPIPEKLLHDTHKKKEK